MSTKSYNGRSIGMAVSEDEVDSLRLTYQLTPCRRNSRQEDQLGIYSLIALPTPHLTFRDAWDSTVAVSRLVKAGIPAGAAVLCRVGEKPAVRFFSVDFDWRVERYYNEADMISDRAKRGSQNHDMIFLFSPESSAKERRDAMRVFKSKLRDRGLNKGVVAMGSDSFVTVYETRTGHNSVLWS